MKVRWKVVRDAVVTALMIFAAIAAVLIAIAQADAHIAGNRDKIVSSRVNGLCGKGSTYFCIPTTIQTRLVRYLGNDWYEHEVQYYESRAFAGPWSVRQCYVKVTVRHNTNIGSPVKPQYCW